MYKARVDQYVDNTVRVKYSVTLLLPHLRSNCV